MGRVGAVDHGDTVCVYFGSLEFMAVEWSCVAKIQCSGCEVNSGVAIKAGDAPGGDTSPGSVALD